MDSAESSPVKAVTGGDIRLHVSVADQRLDVLRDGNAIATFDISTSRYGLGSEPGSLRTPVGRFQIGEKIGADAPVGAVFKAREHTGQTAEQGGDEDLILTRILWLEGLDPENANTRDRYIYIHGTNQEALIGSPASHGCVRMRNADIVRLFDLIGVGTPLEVTA